MFLGKALLLTAAGAAIIAGVAYSTGNHSDAHRPRDVTSMPSAVETPNAVTTPNAAAPSAPATPALPQRNGSGSHHMPGQPSPSSTFGAPAGYELTVVSPTDVAVELAGGKSSNFLWRDPPTPTFERHVRGRVVDEQGRGIAGAVVVISETMRVMFGSLTANEGALTSADGSFDVAVHRDTPERAIALHGRGWSAPIDVPGGKADAAGLVVTIGNPGTLELHARKNHAPLEAEIYVSQPGLELGLETDARGDFSLPRLAPGAYHVRAWPLQMFAGGTSKPMEKDVSVDAGKTTRVDFDLPTGTLLVVTASHAQELMTIEYFLAPGTEQLPLAELNKRARAGAIMDTLFGGQDLDQPMQFHDLAPGTYTLCIDQKATNRDHLPLVCRSIEIKGDKPVVELDVKLP
jgi:hypothetical protein